MGIRGLEMLANDEPPIRILITGSRDWADYNKIYEALALQDRCHEHSDCSHRYVLVSGHCPNGADVMAEDVAKHFGWGVELHPADWRRYKGSAGFRRNAEMVNLGADVCLAFIKNNSKGATMTAELAQKAGIETVIYREDG